MENLKHNLLLQFSVASFVIMLVIAMSTSALITARLNHQILDLQAHNVAMATGTMNPEHPASMPHIINNVTQLRWQVYGAVAGGFVFLYLGLVFIVWGGWRTIARQQATLAKVNSDVRATNEDLTEFSARLEQSNRELEDFASVAAHDLQEPLRKVQAFGERLKGKCGESLSDDGLDYLSRMQGAAGRMQTLITDLLTFSRVTTQAQPFVPVDLGIVAREVLSDLEVRVEQLNAQVELAELPTIDADPLQMRQLLQNLVGNALKFHLDGRPPVVKIQGRVLNVGGNGTARYSEGDSPSEPLFDLTIEDNGIGFEERYLDRIFTIFQRLHGRGEYEGTGVGLAVCRKIAERHGGYITATSRPNEGAAFTVTLPVMQSNTKPRREVSRT